VNKKFADVGSTLLDLLKGALRSLVVLDQLNAGRIELYSVESAVLFYIKQGFVVRDLVNSPDLQASSDSFHKILKFAIKNNDIKIMQKYAEVTPDNFVDFINYLLENTKYGKFFQAYFDAKDGDDSEMQKSVMASRFISSIFNTSMVYQFVRDQNKTVVKLKPLTL
jgi:hypothetical protein